MGAEYLILADLDGNTVEDLTGLLRNNELFETCRLFNGEDNFEFRRKNNKGSMPNFTVIFKKEGIYICRHDCSDLWDGIEEIKTYLEENVKKYTIKDYDE